MSSAATPPGQRPIEALAGVDWWLRGLTEAERSAAGPSPPQWAVLAERAVAEAGQLPPQGGDQGDILLAPLRPFLTNARALFTASVGFRLPREQADADPVAGTCVAVLGRQLGRIAVRTLAYELKLLPVAAGEQRQSAFLAKFCSPTGLAALLAEYPVLARLLGVTAEFAAEALAELLDRFAMDREELVAGLLGGSDPGPVVAIEPGLGDRHRRGRTVAALSFADGRRLIYKPRDVAGQAAFGQIIEWLGKRISGLNSRTPAVLSRPGYGWMEFISPQPLPDRRAAEEFYRREGVLLAALYATHATDMHSENIVANGVDPVLVDVETLFHPTLPIERTTAADPAAEAFARSAQRPGLLPQPTVGESGPVDWSGMGGGQLAGNLPRVDGETLGPVGYEEQILAGFRAGYDAIMADRPGFIELITSFSQLEVRTVVRPTLAYTTLLAESTDPSLLRDGNDRERMLGVLREASTPGSLWDRVAAGELADLRVGDIPRLTSGPATTHLQASDGSRLPDVLESPGLVCAVDKVREMCEIGRREQEWIIRASMATLLPREGHRATGQARAAVTATAAEPGRLLAAACGLADQIVARAAGRDGGDGRVNWLGLQLVENTRWMVLPMGAGLADGYLGVALFLAQLAELTGVDRYADVAARAVSVLPDLLGELTGRPELLAAVGSGAMGGLGGISYGLARLSGLLHEPSLGEWAVTAAEHAATVDDPITAPSWASGSAGFLATALAVAAMTGSATVSAVAQTTAGRLLKLVEQTGGRCVPADDPVPAGFADGPGGVGWTLARYAEHSMDEGYLTGARLAAYQAVSPAEPDDSPGWCSGAAGRLLARTCLSTDRGMLEAAVGTLADRPVHADLSLCHGELGTADVITALAAATESAPMRRAQRHRAGILLNVVNQHGAGCGTPGRVPTPGLLNGLAGIGYGLLRLGYAERVPSVLLLEPASSV